MFGARAAQPRLLAAWPSSGRSAWSNGRLPISTLQKSRSLSAVAAADDQHYSSQMKGEAASPGLRGRPISLTCKAHYVAREMDILRVCQRVYGSAEHHVLRDSIIITGPFTGPNWEPPPPSPRVRGAKRWTSLLKSAASDAAKPLAAAAAAATGAAGATRSDFAATPPPPPQHLGAAGAGQMAMQPPRGRGIFAAAAASATAAAAAGSEGAAATAGGLRHASGRAGAAAAAAVRAGEEEAAAWAGAEAAAALAMPLGSAGPSSSSTSASATPRYAESHVVVYKYGSVVFFNLTEEEQKRHVARIRRECAQSVPVEHQQEEDVSVKVWPGLPTQSHVERDCVVLRELDSDHISVVSSVMGQTVALEFYKLQANRMMEEFARLNAGVEESGMFSKMDKIALFKLVAKNNTVMTDVLYKLGLLERLDLAWRNSQYHDMWESLRTEYELMQRFKDLELKLNLIQHNTKFFVDVLHNQKSDKLEWTIIVLICAEIVIGVAELANYHPFG